MWAPSLQGTSPSRFKFFILMTVDLPEVVGGEGASCVRGELH